MKFFRLLSEKRCGMKRTDHFITVVFTVLMLLFVIFMIWYLPSVSSLRFRISDMEKSLETSRGRERKQEYEYSQVLTELPLVQAELEETLPLLNDADEQVKALKAQRKELRARKKDLEEKLQQSDRQEVQSHD